MKVAALIMPGSSQMAGPEAVSHRARSHLLAMITDPVDYRIQSQSDRNPRTERSAAFWSVFVSVRVSREQMRSVYASICREYSSACGAEHDDMNVLQAWERVVNP
jgi:hypothetical protein